MSTSGATMGRITIEFTIANYRDVVSAKNGSPAPDQVRRVTLQGVVDAGATRLVLPESAVNQLGLTPSGQATVRYADRRPASRSLTARVGVPNPWHPREEWGNYRGA